MFTIAILGSNKVGKTSLFNFFTKNNFFLFNNNNLLNNNTLFNNILDNSYGLFKFKNDYFIFIDVSSYLYFNINDKNFFKKDKDIYFSNKKNILEIIDNVDFIFLLISSLGVFSQDIFIYNFILKRNKKKNTFLIITKIDLYKNYINLNDFYSLGINPIYFVSILDKNSILNIIKNISKNKNIFLKENIFYKKILNLCYNLSDFYFKKKENRIIYNKNKYFINVIILGKPNVGKSTLLNNLSKNYISLVSNISGITRNFIFSNIFINGKNYLLCDSPGFNNKNYILNFSKFYKFFLNFKIVLYLIDINLGISKNDLFFLNFLFNKGKYIILIFNKCNNFNKLNIIKYKKFLKKMYDFMKYIEIIFINAININKRDIYKIFKKIYVSYKNIFLNKIDNFLLTNILKNAIYNYKFNNNILYNKVKLKYLNIIKYNPLIIVIYGIKINLINISYKKYLLNFFMKYLNFKGFKIFLKFKEIDNNLNKKK